MLPPAVVQYLQDHREKHLESLFELLRIPSIANNHDQPDSCQAAAKWLGDYLKNMGFSVQTIPCLDAGGVDRPNVVATIHVGDDRPTLLVYGHYDVQPPDPLALWNSRPFEPVVRDGSIYARGASDDKGPLFAHLMAIEAWQKAGGGLPVNVKVFAEGQEEVGSPTLEPFIAAYAKELGADAAVISDSEFFARGLPSITYSLRGIAYFDVIFKGPATDIHSGQHGGAVTNPVNALARMVAAFHNDIGEVTLEGFYDDVLPLSDAERKAWNALPFDEKEYAASMGLKDLGSGEKGFSVLERRWARPTLDCNGISGGYSGPGSKTIIPAQASVKFSIRMVPRQNPQRIVESVRRFVKKHTPPGIVSSVEMHAANPPVLLATDSPAMRAGKAALKEAFGAETAMIRCGASVPVTEMIQRLLGLDAVMMGFDLPDDNLHGPNEHFRLEQLWNGSVAAAAFMQNLRQSIPGHK